MEDVILREINEIISSPENRAKNPVSLLMEAGAQSRQPVIFNYLDELAMGLINTHIFTCEVKVGRVIKCKGSGHSKKEAKANCAKEALELIRSNTGGTTTSPGASKGSPSHTPFRSTTPTSSLSPARRSLYLPSTDSNPIGSLQEMCMKKNWTPPVYNVTQEEGEAHMKTFTFECKVEDWISQGHGSSKKAAKKLAAEKMLSMISEAPKGLSPVGAHKNGSSSPLKKSPDKHSRLSPLSGSSPSRSSQSNSPVPFLSSDLYDKMETEEPCLNTVSHHCSTPPSVVDAETSVSHEFCSALEDEGKTSGFTVTYHDLPEKGYDGNYMCFVRLDTKPPTVCGGMGHKKQAAHEKAAKNALYYLSTVFSH